jgi:hypothetical protein
LKASTVGASFADDAGRKSKTFQPTAATSGYSYPKRGPDQRIASREPMPPWVIHDLRCSVATHMAELGIGAPHVIEAILNHVSGHKSGVAGIYNRASYEREMRQAFDLWAEHVMALFEDRSDLAHHLAFLGRFNVLQEIGWSASEISGLPWSPNH